MTLAFVTGWEKPPYKNNTHIFAHEGKRQPFRDIIFENFFNKIK